jgi:hypothetical protein
VLRDAKMAELKGHRMVRAMGRNTTVASSVSDVIQSCHFT